MADGNKSHYEILRIPITASEREIKVAYRKAARRAHPDHGGDAAAFRLVTLAYETLIDPLQRAQYDRSYAKGSSSPSGSGWYAGPERASGQAGGRTSAGVHRPSHEARNTAGDEPVYVPPFGVPGEVPLIPESTARQQVHGLPRRRGIFGAEARIQREMRTVQLISRQILPTIPAARLINGLQSPSDNSHIDHAVLSGYRLALVGSMLLPKGAYAWDGNVLRHGGRSLVPPQLAPVVRGMQEAFPELNVTGWIVIHSPEGNLHEPVIDYYRRSHGSHELQVVNAAGLARSLKQFLASGPAPNTVVVPALARLLRGMH